MTSLISLNQNKDFRRMYYRCKAYVDPALVVYFSRNRAGCCRLGITAGKKVGGAVQRNRAKRVIRAAYRSCADEIAQSGNYDIVIVARSKTAHIKSTAVEATLRKLLKKGGIIK